MNDYSFDGKSSEAVLARLLRYILKADADDAAKELVSTLGSFSYILEATPEELQAVGGINKEAAVFLKQLQSAVKFYLEDKATGVQRVYDNDSAAAILRPKFFGKRREIVVLLLLDGRGRILYNDVVNEGSVSEVPIYIRRLVELCLRYDAYTAMIAHNHPSGNPLPSKNDINATRDLEFALNGIDVELTDHLIFTDMDYISLKSSEWLDEIKAEVRMYKNALREETMEQEDFLATLKKEVRKEDDQAE